MTLVGTRPESTHYVKKYTPEMFATLLLPAGVTSEASIKYKDEAELQDIACIRQKGKIYNLKVSHITLVDIFLHVHYNKRRKNTHGIPRK